MSNQVYTITFNPTVDYVVECDGEIQQGLNRLKETNFFVGGKGLNVSRVLKNFGYNSKAFGFVGGFTGDFVRGNFTRKGIAHDFEDIDDFTRLNVKIKGTPIELNGNISKVSDENFDRLMKKILTVEPENYLMIGGSTPLGCTHFFDKTLKGLECKNMKLVIDIGGGFLRDTLKYKPFLLKPNLSELCEAFGCDITSKEDVIKYATELHKGGAKHVLVSLGGKGAVLVCEEGTFVANQKDVEVINAVGCGDAVVAGFLQGCILGEEVVDKFKRAVLCGISNAISNDLATEKDFEKVQGFVTIEKI